MYGYNYNLNCLSAKAWRVDKELNVTTHRIGKDLIVSAKDVTNKLNISIRVVCDVNPEFSPFEYFLVSEGKFVLLLGHPLKVSRNGISE